MDEPENNPYQTPQARLDRPAESGDITNFKRISAWWVFGLSIITLGIYPVYWMYTRSKTLNSFHRNEIPMYLPNTLVIIVVASFAAAFFEQSEIGMQISLLINILYMVIYLTVLFTLRSRLMEVMNGPSAGKYYIGPVITFFFNAIYLQFKINQCIDNQSNSYMLG